MSYTANIDPKQKVQRLTFGKTMSLYIKNVTKKSENYDTKFPTLRLKTFLDM